MQTKLGEFMREMRLEAELSLRALGEEIGVSYTSLAEMETGKRRVPRKHIPALCEALGLTLAEKKEFRLLWDADLDAREAAERSRHAPRIRG